MVLKRTVLGLLVVMAVLSFSLAASAGDYPTKPAKLLIPFGAGGSADFMGRAIAKATEKYFGQPIVAVNRPGAGGGIMYTALKNSKPDGYTLGWSSTGLLTVTNIGNVPFFYDAFEHVCRIGYSALPIAVRADSPWKTFEEFIDYARKNPGKIKIGNAGTGSATHLTPIVIEKRLGVKFIHVPLGAKRRVPSLLGGEVEAICVPLPEVAPQVRAGKARVLVVPSERRDPGFPDVPTLKELGYDIVIELFRGIAVPKGTPESIIGKLEDSFRKGAQEASFVDISKKNSFNVSFMDRRTFESYVKDKNDMIAEIMKAAGLKKK
ncbi:MAG: tripartite tricarboxylate transporter substrate binding protein [Deltaproteobacteria bacterium]|nr:tripartite tricarboxylate transporter substrate binding protein [Deltaproteobacteria bacterium]